MAGNRQDTQLAAPWRQTNRSVSEAGGHGEASSGSASQRKGFCVHLSSIPSLHGLATRTSKLLIYHEQCFFQKVTEVQGNQGVSTHSN